jgi:hypothetical protein
MVKLPKEVADAIHYFQTKGREKSLFNIPTISSASTKEKRYKVIHEYIHGSDENFKKYFKALVDGYEVEQTKEERLRDVYACWVKEGNERAIGVEIALAILGIEIKGVTN